MPENKKEIYTHNEAAYIIELFEELLVANNIKLPSPEDDNRDPDNDAALYGTTYSELLDEVEWRLIYMLQRHDKGVEVITQEFSGDF